MARRARVPSVGRPWLCAQCVAALSDVQAPALKLSIRSGSGGSGRLSSRFSVAIGVSPAVPYVSMQRRTGDVADSTPGTESFSGGVAVADHAVLPRREGGMALARAMSTDFFFFFKKKQRCSVLSITSSIIWFLESVA